MIATSSPTQTSRLMTEIVKLASYGTLPSAAAFMLIAAMSTMARKVPSMKVRIELKKMPPIFFTDQRWTLGQHLRTSAIETMMGMRVRRRAADFVTENYNEKPVISSLTIEEDSYAYDIDETLFNYEY